MYQCLVTGDIPRIYTAIAEWTSCTIFFGILEKRFSKGIHILISILALIIESVFLVMTDNVERYLWVPCMLVAFGLMVLFIYCCCDITLMQATYFAVISFVTAEFMASLEWQITDYIWGDDGYCPLWLQIIMIALVYGSVCFILWFLLHAHHISTDKGDLEVKDFIAAVIIGIAVFATSNLSFLNINTPFSGSYLREIENIRTIVDLGGIAMLYAHQLHCMEYKTRKELESVQSALQNQYVQYKQSRDSIELINYKYHDLKHQIAYLRSETDADKRSEFLNHMEEDIRQYEIQNKTGNSVLDIVLAGKSLYCNKHTISLTTVADGSLLDFMDTMDICSIFGNALDNAIECELKISDKEKRLIHVTVSKLYNFVLICVENYFEGSLVLSNGNPATTKKEKEFHGYGIKSIRYIANKYKGAVDIETKDNWFIIRILIPLQ